MDELERAITELLQRHRGLIRTLLNRNSHRFGHVDADDVEQEVALRLYQVLKRETKIQHPASYIASVVNTTLLDVIRKAGRRLPEGADSSQTEPVSPEQEPALRLQHQQQLQQVEHCLQQLPTNRAIAVRLHLQGYSHREMADITGWSTGKIRNLVSRGMQTLKARLKERGVELDEN